MKEKPRPEPFTEVGAGGHPQERLGQQGKQLRTSQLASMSVTLGSGVTCRECLIKEVG